MKAKIRILLVIVLAAVLCMSNKIMINIGEETKSTDGEVETVDNFIWMSWEAATKDDGDIEIKYDITDNGDNHYNVDVTLENMTDDRIDNWEIWIPVNYEIQNIWNAKIIDHYDNKYTIHNAEWNQDIPVDGSVSFGMTVTCSDKVEMPSYVYTTTSRQTVKETDYKFEFKKHRQKDKKFTGRIIITNQRQERLEDWGIDLDSNFKIVKIENAILVDKSLEDDLKYVDEFILDSDYFETREEYEQYLEEHGLTDDALIELR